jgi:hypothetical protein
MTLDFIETPRISQQIQQGLANRMAASDFSNW